jgi:arginyl-tRNA synthetase
MPSTPRQQPSFVLESPPNRDLGDLGTPVAFELARRLRKAPKVIAAEIAGASASVPGCGRSSPRPTATSISFSTDRSFLRER